MPAIRIAQEVLLVIILALKIGHWLRSGPPDSSITALLNLFKKFLSLLSRVTTTYHAYLRPFRFYRCSAVTSDSVIVVKES